MLKRIFSIFAISLIITGLFFECYTLKCPVYADDTLDGWMNVTTNAQLVEAFRYYCKSRDLTIEGSLADGVTSFTTKTFNGLCNTLGYDLTALQAQIKYRTDSNLGLQYLFTATGIDAYNQIFAQFLQDNELEVGDTDVDKTVYSGKYFVDDEGNACMVYVTDSTHICLYEGTTYRFNFDDLYYRFVEKTYTFDSIVDDITYTFTLTGRGSISSNIENSNGEIDLNNGGNYNVIWNKSRTTHTVTYQSDFVIVQNISDGYLYFGTFNWIDRKVYTITKIESQTAENLNVKVVSTVINNNTYEGDTIINNEGDIINNYPDDPDVPPSNPSIPDDGGWQDFQLPSMPNDWLIYGMEKKFPFDIPFNIMFALSLLNHEPEIPKFQGDIDLKVCTWHYDIDLTPFDDIATILRRFEVLAFIIGLAILTKELIMWG